MKNKNFVVILTAVVFALMIVINASIFYFINSGPALSLASTISWITAAILSIIIAFNYAVMNKKSDENKSMGSYLKKIWATIILMVLFGIGLSFVGGIVLYGVIVAARGRIDGFLLNGAILTIPFFIIFLIGIYRSVIKLGFMDAQKKSYNFNFKLVTMLLVLIFLMPSTFLDNMYNEYHVDDMWFNVQAVLSTNIDLSAVGDFGMLELSENFSMTLTIIKILIIFTIESAVMLFAYRRGKKIFIAEHMRRDADYQTDEIY